MTDLNPWPMATLSELVDLRLSSVDKKSKPDETPVLLCNYTDVYRNRIIHSDLDFMEATATDREIEKCALQPGDVIITKDSEQYDDIGVPALVRGDAPDLVCGYHLAILRPRDDLIDGAYLFNALTTREVQHQFHAFANGVTRFGLRKADIERIQIPVPPMEEQRRIAGVLGCLDDKIELNRRIAETLEQMARALFRSWFVDFEPVRAKQDGRWSPAQSLPGLPAHLYDAFPDRLEPSPLGPIPAGWRVAALGDIADAPRRGINPDEIDPDTPYIGLEHMPRRSIALGEWDTAAKVASGKSAFNRGEILFGKLRPYFHKVGVAPLDGICSTDIIVIEPKAQEWASFVLFVVSSDEFVAHANQTSTGTRMPRTSWKAMSAYDIALPPAPVAQAFEEVVRATTERIAAQIHESQCLATQRDALLPRLLASPLQHLDQRVRGR